MVENCDLILLHSKTTATRYMFGACMLAIEASYSRLANGLPVAGHPGSTAAVVWSQHSGNPVAEGCGQARHSTRYSQAAAEDCRCQSEIYKLSKVHWKEAK